VVKRDELVAYCDRLLDVGGFSDYCPNGLQVEGREEIGRIVSGVTASQALIDAAVAAEADLLLVHHGFFWKGEDARITGMKRRRLGALLAADLNLLAYHLPLDAHSELGNNVQLARLLELPVSGRFGPPDGPDLACWGELEEPLSTEALAERLEARLGHRPLHLGPRGPIRRLGWCTGAAQSWLDAAADLGLDAFISGEVSEPTAHVAAERGIQFLAAGHHATERHGPRALGEHLARKFELDHRFIDLYVPV